ncbi:MAG: OmpA family protein [Gemmatimonadaceae bacterium]|nr:OmpA family protein [Acetobacteraceae bacterium]
MQFRTLLLATVAIALPALAQAQAVDGLYIGGGVGYNSAATRGTEARQGNAYYFDSIRTGRDGTVRLDGGYVGLLSVGYGFGNGIRLELEGNYRENEINKIGGFSGRGLSGGGVTSAFGAISGTQRQYGAMANVFYDLDLLKLGVLGYALTPYVGAGVGYMVTDYDNVRATRGAPNGNTVRIDGDSGRFAYQGIAGIAAPIPGVPGLSLTAEYRYAGSLKPDINGSVTNPSGGLVSTGKYRFSEQNNHSGLIGVRYAFNTAPPPAPTPVPVAAPQRDVARTYLVFFDWDRADLTDRARQIIADAAQATTRAPVTRIEVAGHTDKSGTPAYNQGLSVRRAQNVAAELVRLGVPRAAITTQGFGEANPLVATADGVREPQNRRVEIVLR